MSKMTSANQRHSDKRKTIFSSDLFWLVLLLLIAGLLRFVELGQTPFHHDESIHAWFSFRLWQGHPYKYDPIYHGPILYLTNALVYSLFGASDFTARLLPALFSLGLIVLVFSIRRHLGKIGWVVSGLFISLSPTFNYYGRFLAHDNYVAFFTLALVVLGLRFRDRKAFLNLLLMGVIFGLFYRNQSLLLPACGRIRGLPDFDHGL